MANIVYRGPSAGLNENTIFKDDPLLNSEIDGNFNGLNQELATKAPSENPTFTGTPVAPTAAAGTNTTQLATTAFVNAERSNFTTLTNKTLLLQTPVDFPITSGSADGTKLTLNVTGTINTGAINVGDTVTITNTTNYNGTFIVTDVVDADTFKVASTIASGTAMGGSSQTVSKYNTDGSIAWDSSNDLLTVGTGTARKILVDTDSAQALTNKTVNKLTITAPTTSATLTIANGKTLTVNNTVTLSGNDASTLAFGAGGTIAYTGGNLSQFASTTSAQLATVISDETGSGALVFASEPTITKPNFNNWITTPVVYGSDVSGGSLTLTSTENTTKGEVILGGAGDNVKLNTTTAGFVKTSNTGVFSIDVNSYYYDGGTDVKVVDGGTGLSTVPTNGQLLIGNGTGYTLSTLSAGNAISITNAAGSITVNHTDTSTQGSISNSGNTFIQDITLDTYGHITAIDSATVDFNVSANYAFQNVSIGADSGYTWGTANTNTTQAADSSSDTLTLVNGGGINLYTNTVVGADAVRIEHADTSSLANVDNSNGTVIQDLTFDTYGHVTAVGSVDLDNRYVQKVGDTISGNLTVTGNLTVNGSTSTINTTTVTVDDKNIELGAVGTKTGLIATLSTGTNQVTLTTGNTNSILPGQKLTKTAGTGAFGAGTALTITIGVTGGAISSVAIGSGGTLYTVGDIVTISGGTGGTARITSTNGLTGVVTGIELVTPGSGYTAGTKSTVMQTSFGVYVLSVTSETVFTTNVNHGTAGSITFSTGGAIDATADGGGITLKGTTDKTLTWDNTNKNWTSSEHFNLASGKSYKINNVSVLSSNTLGSGITASSLTSVGTIATGTWQGTTIATGYGGTGLTSYAAGDIIYASATNTLSKLAKGDDGQFLTLASGVPSWTVFKSSSSNVANSLVLRDANGDFSAGVVSVVSLQETRVAMPANDINLDTANFFTKTISGSTTLTVSNVPAAGIAASFILDLTNGGSATITWWSGVKWANGIAPSLTGAGRDVLGFFTYDGGTTWTGLLLGKDVK